MKHHLGGAKNQETRLPIKTLRESLRLNIIYWFTKGLRHLGKTRIPRIKTRLFRGEMTPLTHEFIGLITPFITIDLGAHLVVRDSTVQVDDA